MAHMKSILMHAQYLPRTKKTRSRGELVRAKLLSLGLFKRRPAPSSVTRGRLLLRVCLWGFTKALHLPNKENDSASFAGIIIIFMRCLPSCG